MDNLLVFNIKTNGYNSFDDEIRNVAFNYYYDDECLNEFCFYFNSENSVLIENKQIRLTIDYQNEQYEEYLSNLEDVFFSFQDLSEEAIIVGYNIIRFGIPFLNKQFDYYGIDCNFKDNIIQQYYFHDVLLWAKKFHKVLNLPIKDLSLKGILEIYEISFNESDLEDNLVCTKLIYQIYKKQREFGMY